ncbi:hypothetical protein [Nitrospirillum amazonense]|uniref:hypothetical protein n=1 Tax=Nitrospirillum amazonense TaxID=28077 RepID=UPI002412294B|nr:hypothetical protein [Nitrospirillum amazonense]MDG3441726.1 hypothetical protein [Nitrospirillum amazonense]
MVRFIAFILSGLFCVAVTVVVLVQGHQHRGPWLNIAADIREKIQTPCAARDEYLSAKRLQAQGQQDISIGNYDSALQDLKSGIEALGGSYNDYGYAALLDHSDERIMLAKDDERAGNVRNAALLYGNALERRLALCEVEPKYR